MSAFRCVEARDAGPTALGVLAPPGRRTHLILRPRALPWDLVLLQPGHSSVFHELDRDEATAAGAEIARALEEWAAGGSGPRRNGRRAAGTGRLGPRPRRVVRAAAVSTHARPTVPGAALRRRRVRPRRRRRAGSGPAPAGRRPAGAVFQHAPFPPLTPRFHRHALYADPRHARLRPVAGRPAGAARPPQPPTRRPALRQVQRPRRQTGSGRGRGRLPAPRNTRRKRSGM